jgi:hypothetical protein
MVADDRGMVVNRSGWLFGEAVDWLKYVYVLKRPLSYEVKACEGVGDADVTDDAGVKYTTRDLIVNCKAASVTELVNG